MFAFDPSPAAPPVAARPQPIPELVQACAGRWWACPLTLPEFDIAYSPCEQAQHEARLAHWIGQVIALLDDPPEAVERQQAARAALTASALALLTQALCLEPTQLEALQPHALADLALEFTRAARRFDPALTMADIYQASRNAVTAGVLQVLLGQPVRLTPAIFAYSLLYPYSDNLLDDPHLPTEAKRAFNARFRDRLAGVIAAPAANGEARINDLVGQIEACYDRVRDWQVWDSLLAIHAAQGRSLQLERRGTAPYEVDVLGLTFEKGGTSVLADGCLVSGRLTAPEAEFCFGLGAFLQLADDLEDVAEDLKDGRLSVFTLAASHGSLDALTNRVLHFGADVLAGAAHLPAPGGAGRQAFLRRAAALALIHSAGRASRFYSRRYLQALETHSPVRFAFVEQQRRRLTRRQFRWTQLLDRVSAWGLTAPPHLAP